MRLSDLLHSISKKLLLLIVAFIIVIAILFYMWQTNKFAIVKNKLANVIIRQTDSLYTIKYDSLFFDELKGEAFLKNVSIKPDTFRVKKTSLAQLPYMLLDVTIRSLAIKGVKTDKALNGNEMIGDSVIIDNPVIFAYFLKPIKKETKIDAEAKEVYEQILGKLDLIQVAHVSIKNAEVHAMNFRDHERQFDIINTNINLNDVRIDSVNSEDTSRVLFCKDASFQIDQFTSYNENRNEVNVSNIKFSGKEHKLSFYKLLLNRFNVEAPEGIKLVEADEFFINGINTFEIVKNKNGR